MPGHVVQYGYLTHTHTHWLQPIGFPPEAPPPYSQPLPPGAPYPGGQSAPPQPGYPPGPPYQGGQVQVVCLWATCIVQVLCDDLYHMCCWALKKVCVHIMYMCVRMCVCVYVCVWERERAMLTKAILPSRFLDLTFQLAPPITKATPIMDMKSSTRNISTIRNTNTRSISIRSISTRTRSS